MPFNCVVIVREVWDVRDLAGQVLDGQGQIKAGAVPHRFEPEDLNALEMALRVKDEHGGQVTAVTIGQPVEVDVLRECLYRGTDKVVRIDADMKSLDTQAAAQLLAAAIKQLDDVHLVLTGVTVAEGENSLLGSHVAAALGIEQISYVDGLVSLSESAVVGRRGIEMGYEDVEAQLPALMTVGVALLEDDPRTPRSAKAMLKLKAKKAEIPVLAAADLGSPSSTTEFAGYVPVEEKTVDSKDIDPDDEAALKSMLDDVLKGE